MPAGTTLALAAQRTRRIASFELATRNLIASLAEASLNATNDYIAKIARLYLLEPHSAPEPGPDDPRLLHLIHAGYVMALSGPKGFEVFTKRICGDYRKHVDVNELNATISRLYGLDETSAATSEMASTASVVASEGEDKANMLASPIESATYEPDAT